MKLIYTVRMLVTVVFSMLVLPVASSNDEEPIDQGAKLFSNYGCVQCHGENGVHPTSKYVPVLKGKPAAYIIENANAIFGGVRDSSMAYIMHDQFCSGGNASDPCPSAPSSEELQMIATWLDSGVALPDKKKTPQGLYISSREAHQKLEELGDSALFIDIRTRAEIAFLGMPELAHANIPYMSVGDFSEWDDKKNTFKLQANSGFVLQVEDLVAQRGLNKQSPIFLLCRSGNRSAKAARVLYLSGYEQVYNIFDGFEGDKAKQGPLKGQRIVNGWKNSGLPWTYELDKTAMYWEM